MIDLDATLCYCNNLTAGEILACIKTHRLTTLDEVLAQDFCPVGDKCEACHEEGWNNDGFSIAMLLALIEEQKL